jgi:hypothetical protein
MSDRLFPVSGLSNAGVSSRRSFLFRVSAGLASPFLLARSALAQGDSQADGFQLPRARPQTLKPEFRTTLQQYGAFSQHPVYGEIWTPGAQTVP